MNQHHIEVGNVEKDGKRIHSASCECGWQGPNRDSYYDAVDDGMAHHLAEIPDDAWGSIYS